MTESDILKRLIIEEYETEINDYKVIGIPIWRILRFKFRTQYLKSVCGFEYQTKPLSININKVLKNSLSSLIGFLKILFSKKYRVDNLFFAFPRLQKWEDMYFDKFTDPVISRSALADNFLIFQRPLGFNQFNPRLNARRTIHTDFIEVFSRIMGILIIPLVFLFFYYKIINIKKTATKIYLLPKIKLKSIAFAISIFVVNYTIYKILFLIIKPKQVFLVDREIFFPVIKVCKKLGIKTYELQHGITVGETPLYSGHYDPSIDPDFFLVFGDVWIGKQFGIPIEKIINIGWAYKSMRTKLKPINISKYENAVLVISSPHITDKILSITIDLAKDYPNQFFHIRLHPQEALNNVQEKFIYNLPNIKLVDNLIDSSIALMSYTYIIGENSSVLYEALSLGKLVGILCYGGIISESTIFESRLPFVYLKERSDFKIFLQTTSSDSAELEKVYSNFKDNILNEIYAKK